MGEDRGDVLEGEAGEQAGEQPIALLGEQQLLVEVDVGVAGEQAAGLQLDEGGGDHQELGGDLEIERRASRRGTTRYSVTRSVRLTSVISSRCEVISWSRRSSGPSKTAVVTS